MPGLYPQHPAIARFRVGQYGGHGLLNAAWLAHLQTDPNMQDAVLCMDLVFGSELFHCDFRFLRGRSFSQRFRCQRAGGAPSSRKQMGQLSVK